VDVEITNIAKLNQYRIGFGSYLVSGGDIRPIKGLAEIGNPGEVKFEIPTKTAVKGKKAPSIVKELSGLAFIKELSDRSIANPVTTSINNLLQVLDGKLPEYPNCTLAKLYNNDGQLKNFKGWNPFDKKVRYGTKITNKNRSVSKYLPIVEQNMTMQAEKDITEGERNRLKEGVKNLVKSIPLKPNNDSIVESTPMVHYFLSRYIASLLLPQAKEAIAVTAKTDTANNLPFLERITKLNKDLDSLISDAINLSPDVKTEVDAIFDMSPVGSTINYPDDDSDDPAIADNTIINQGTHIEAGLLQQLYSTMPTNRRTKFKEHVAEIIKTLDVSKKHTNEAGKSFYTIDPEIFEQVLVWIEEIELKGAIKQKNIDFVSGIDGTMGIDTMLNEVLSETATIGSEIQMPGWMMMKYSIDGGQSFLQGFVSEECSFRWENRSADGDSPSGFEELKYNSEDEEQRGQYESFEESAYEYAKMSGIPGTIKDIGNDGDKEYIEIRFTVNGNPHTTKMDRKELMENELDADEKSIMNNQYNITQTKKFGLKSSRVAGENLFDGFGEFPSFGEELLKESGFILASDAGLGVELAYPLLIEVSDDPMGTEVGLSRGFQALGDILMHLVKQNAVEISNKSKSSSAFDRAVDGLLGTHNKPGPASYHAQIQHSVLYENAGRALRESDKSGIVALGSNLVFEQYSRNPAKLMVLWMLANYNLIDMGGFTKEGQPQFFSLPATKLDKLRAEADLMNKMAIIIISYYRLAFYPLRLKNQGTEKEDFNLKKEWPRLLADAKTNGPDPYAFATVLRFLTKSEKLTVEIPAWMPALPNNFSGLDDRIRQQDEVVDFLRWSYGTNSSSKEHFCEIAAAYHAAKALSYTKPGEYATMIKQFVDAVEAERGEGFLISVLIAYAAKDNEVIGGIMPVSDPIAAFQTLGGTI